MPYREDGSYEPGGGFVPGVDFDPSDRDEMEVLRALWKTEDISSTQVPIKQGEQLSDGRD